MKRFSRKGLFLCLVCLLAVSLLTVPAFADGEIEEEGILVEAEGFILGTMDPDTKCVKAGAWTYDLSLLDEATKDMSREEKSNLEASIEARLQRDAALSVQEGLQAEADATAQAAYCTNPDHPKTNTSTFEYAPYPQPSDTSHSITHFYWETCTVCLTRKFLSSFTTSEPHTLGSGRYVSSNHTGAYANHTHTYAYTCVSCKQVVRKSVSAGCTAGGCVDPYSLEEPLAES